MKKLILLLLVPFIGIGQVTQLKSHAPTYSVYVQPSTPAPAFHADYQAVLTYATNQGWTLPSSAQQTKQNNIVDSLDLIGLWDSIDVFYVMANDGSSNFARINWKDTSQYLLTLIDSPVWTSNQGFTGNTTTATRLETNYQPSVHLGNYTLNDCSFGMWIHDIGGGGTDFLFGDFARNLLRKGGSTARITANISTTIAAPDAGWISLERSNSSNFLVNNDGTTNSYSTPSGNLDDNPFDLLNRHNQNVSSDATMSFFYAGDYIGTNEIFKILRTYMNNL